MIFLLHIFYGVSMSYLGLISPGMLNMTTLKIRIHYGKNESLKFAIGAAFIVFIQAGIALYFADFLVKNPEVIEALRYIAVVVLFGLSGFFFWLSRKKLKVNSTERTGNFLIKGMIMSLFNMLAVPFYLGVSIYLASVDKIIIEHPYILLFVFGASFGAFLLFYTYMYFAKFIDAKIRFIAKNINLILSTLFFLLGILTLIKTLP